MVGITVCVFLIFIISIISCVVLVPSFARATTCFLSNITTNSVRLTWPNVTGATRYTYNYGSGDVNVSSDATSVNVNGLTSATNYKFLVTVYGQSGTGNTIACGGSTGKVNFQVLSVGAYRILYCRQNTLKRNGCITSSIVSRIMTLFVKLQKWSGVTTTTMIIMMMANN